MQHKAKTPSNRPSAHHRGYNSRWRKARATWLRNNPLCVMCLEQQRHTPATIVDHIKPHKGDPQLFWDTSNWQSLCKQHHDGAKQAQERSGYIIGSDASGVPLDASHHWHR